MIRQSKFSYSLTMRAFTGFALLLIMLLGGCRSAKIPFPSGNNGEEIDIVFDGSISKSRREVIKESHKWLGTPYKYGGSELGKSADCSGMVMKVYLEATGIKLPRTSLKQSEFCKKIKKNHIRPGDLVFFATGKDPDRVSHVGIMLDSERFIHASSSKGVVVSNLSTPYYTRKLLFFGKVPELD